MISLCLKSKRSRVQKRMVISSEIGSTIYEYLSLYSRNSRTPQVANKYLFVACSQRIHIQFVERKISMSLSLCLSLSRALISKAKFNNMTIHDFRRHSSAHQLDSIIFFLFRFVYFVFLIFGCAVNALRYSPRVLRPVCASIMPLSSGHIRPPHYTLQLSTSSSDHGLCKIFIIVHYQGVVHITS